MRSIIILLLILIFAAGVLPVFLKTSPKPFAMPEHIENDGASAVKSEKYVPISLSDRPVFGSAETITEVAKPTILTKRQEDFRLNLVGVTIVGKRETAIFTSEDSREKVTLNIGDSYAGWILEDISSSQVLLSQDGKSTRIHLFVSESKGKN